jgi:hypothetical protein
MWPISFAHVMVNIHLVANLLRLLAKEDVLAHIASECQYCQGISNHGSDMPSKTLRLIIMMPVPTDANLFQDLLILAW